MILPSFSSMQFISMMSTPFTRRNEGILLLKLVVFVIRIEVSEVSYMLL